MIQPPKLSKDYLNLLSKCHPGGHAFSYQLKWVSDTSKYKLGTKARQIGITTTESIDNFLECLLWKPSDAAPSPPVIVCCSPSQRQSNRLMDYVMRVRGRLEELHKTRIKFRKEKEDRLLFDNYSELWSLPNNPRTVEGIDASKVVIDEFGNFIGHEDADIYNSTMGSLGAKDGRMILFGKPHGRRGLFWKLYDPYGEFAQHYSIHKLDWTVRANEDKRYKASVLEHKLRMSPLQFKENYEAEFVDENVLVFPYELLDKQKTNLKVYTLDDEYSTGLPVYMGIDFGRKVSQSAITCVEKDGDKVRVMFHEVSDSKFDQQVDWIIRSIEHFRPIMVNVDKTGPGVPILDYLTTRFGSLINGVHFNPGTKDKLVLNTKHLLETGNLLIPESSDYHDLYEQIHGIEKTISDSGVVKYTGKRTETDWLDDRAWSFFLSVYSLNDGSWSFLSLDTAVVTKKHNDAYTAWARGEDV